MSCAACKLLEKKIPEKKIEKKYHQTGCGCHQQNQDAVVLRQKNLVSNVPQMGLVESKNLINPWGMFVNRKTKSVWIANNGSSTVSKFRFSDSKIYESASISTPSNPTGLIVNENNNSFFISNSNKTKSAPAKIITATEGGVIAGYHPKISDSFVILKDVSSTKPAVYKGLAIADGYLFVANFFGGVIEQYDSNMNLVETFTDTDLVNSGFAPFNIISIGHMLLVSFAKQDDTKTDDVAGDGNGYIDIFEAKTGKFVKRFAEGGKLNSPWAMLPLIESGQSVLLVGNFGDGTIHVFDSKSGEFLHSYDNTNGLPLQISGLWSLAKVPGKKSVFFTAGIDNEQNGLFGKLSP
jgi:uncharacterized protein (TIGR03118 family)